MKIYYLGEQIVGLIGRLTVLSLGHKIVKSVNDSDILLSVHSRKIIPRTVFEKPKIASINVHPYLYCYKGADPIGRAIKDKNWRASVGCHHIIENVDCGEVIKEIFIEHLIPSNNPVEIYNQLYPIYSQVITESLKILERKYLDNMEEPNPIVGGFGVYELS